MRILLCTDGSPAAAKAVHFGLHIARTEMSRSNCWAWSKNATRLTNSCVPGWKR